MKTNKKTALLLAFCAVLSLTFSSCDKEETEPTVTKDLYFEADMDGKSLLLPEGKDGYLSKATAQLSTNASGCVETQSMQLTKASDSKKSFEVRFVKKRNTCFSDCSQSKALLQKGTYAFGRLAASSDQSKVDGVVIRYIDVYGKVWSTDFGAANQNNSNFTVTATEENRMDTKSVMLVSAEFNCKLYDGEGNEMSVTNGKVVSRSIVCK